MGERAVASVRLVWLLVLLIVAQSLMVQAHAIAHLPPPQLPAPVLGPALEGHKVSHAAPILTHRHPGDGDDPAQCPLCREEALSGHYLAPEPFEFAPLQPDHVAPSPVLRPVGHAQTAPARSRIRGPPASSRT
ncbi:hypothetical protein [Novosphingobium sp. 9]|uniref:hypothetical protein n=1 Tax=Novosphingobium sp. 9 TaxID=2025349 RepID=UPI0021B601E3|nr:hypothetical protein [Novosphingobium sp. 9]